MQSTYYAQDVDEDEILGDGEVDFGVDYAGQADIGDDVNTGESLTLACDASDACSHVCSQRSSLRHSSVRLRKSSNNSKLLLCLLFRSR